LVKLATNMLRDTDASVVSIGAAFRHASQTAFAVAFKRLTGDPRAIAMTSALAAIALQLDQSLCGTGSLVDNIEPGVIHGGVVTAMLDESCWALTWSSKTPRILFLMAAKSPAR
jgi:hypothetical protein